MAKYIAIPKGTNVVNEVATGTALKTVLQVLTPSTTAIKLLGWGISFDGIVVTDPAGTVVLLDTASSTPATVTSQTPEPWGHVGTNASLCVGGTTATGYNATAEGTITSSRILDAQNVHPQTGYSIWFPNEPIVNISRSLRIRTTFGITVNCIPWILWDE